MLLGLVQNGDLYEVNFCVSHHAHAPGFDPLTVFPQPGTKTLPPFAAMYRRGPSWALCFSPERFLSFHGDRVLGQPMKGTSPRGRDAEEDRRLAMELANHPKERSENIMALDVMRHDLSRVAASRSVRVEELCGVRAHDGVLQMTSTVSARLAPGRSPYDALLAAFPPASMTGAPKENAMRWIDAVEDGPRGLYSGTLGFFAPDGTGDFNVVIRTVLFDARTGRATLTTGSALTAACDPEAEWEECMLKVRSVLNALGHAR
jgi:para-aminobenzoate synthetase component 1